MMPERNRKPPDWTKTGTIAGYAKYLREHGGALAVIVIRRDDSVLSVDDAIAPRDVAPLLAMHIGDLVEDLPKARTEKRPARAKLRACDGVTE